MSNVKIIALGNAVAGDDKAAIEAVSQLSDSYNVVLAGRPGLDLIDYLDCDEPVIIADVTKFSGQPGRIFNMSMEALQEAAMADVSYSNYGFGPSETLKLIKSLDKSVPQGRFIGVEGMQFKVGSDVSHHVQKAIPAFIASIKEAVKNLGGLAENKSLHSA